MGFPRAGSNPAGCEITFFFFFSEIPMYPIVGQVLVDWIVRITSMVALGTVTKLMLHPKFIPMRTNDIFQ